ncbi:MAG: Crp/Fnr family transcriptional regulator [Propionibacteriaceae bacterium]|jgi:CRP-like cAMP-binding protein|nr:Crp/Fnr family transcriptional regulator [Propionibacteriaceae bacterium]
MTQVATLSHAEALAPLADTQPRWTRRLDAPRHTDLLPFIDPDSLPAVASRIREISVRKGDVLFRTGDEPDGMYRIMSGKVKVQRTPDVDSTGQQNVLGVYGPDQIFGAMSICDPGPRNATAIAVTDCVLRFISREDCEELFYEEPSFARSIMFQVARHLRLAQNATSALVLQDVPGRVARAVVLLATRFGERRPDGTIQVRHDMTQADIASMVGASREAVNKAFAEFNNRGWVWSSTKSFIVLDYDRIVRRAGEWQWEDQVDVTPVTPYSPWSSRSPESAESAE